MSDRSSKATIIVMADGDTDYLFLDKALTDDPDISDLPITIVRPEDIGLKRRDGGGHKTLLKEAGLAAIKAAQGFASGVLVLVDNDGDKRFEFPHEEACGACRECEAYHAIDKIQWGRPFRKSAVILYQAVETILLSARSYYTPQMEGRYYSSNLKRTLYGKDFINSGDQYNAFQKELEILDINKIKARSYPRLKEAFRKMSRK